MLSHRKRNLEHVTSGQALIEFALVLLFVILPLMFVLTDGAMTLYTYSVLTNAAREGARAGSIYQIGTPPSFNLPFADQVAAIDSARESFIRQEMQQQIGPLVSFSQCNMPHPIYNPDPPELGNTFREMDSMSIRLECPRRLLFGLIGTGQITLTAQSTMRIEPGGAAPATPTPGP